jgi:hypothetical protein
MELRKQRVWIPEGRPRGLQFPSDCDYKQAKRDFRNALDKEHYNYMRKVYSDIDKAAEVNVRLSWKQTKRRKPRTSRVYPEICDENGVTHTDPNGVLEAFASFFERLYAPLDKENFDNLLPCFLKEHREKFQHLKTESESDFNHIPGGIITSKEVIITIYTLKMLKTPGADLITNEHITHGGKPLHPCLLKLFNAVVKCGHVPVFWKRSLRVPLYKGSNKPRFL